MLARPYLIYYLSFTQSMWISQLHKDSFLKATMVRKKTEFFCLTWESFFSFKKMPLWYCSCILYLINFSILSRLSLFLTVLQIRASQRSITISLWQALAWHMANSCKWRKRRLRQVMKSPPKGKAVWADIAHAEFKIACPDLILIDLT